MWNKQLKGWKVAEVFKDADEKNNSGYYGALYKHIDTHQLVLAHRGTNSFSAVKTDATGIVRNLVVPQQAWAFHATKTAAAHAEKEGYSLSFTGHSLGAWLAELSAYFSLVHYKHKAKTVTFDSPGSYPAMEKFQTHLKNKETPKIKDLDIVTYLSLPNIVNSLHDRAGYGYCLFPELKHDGAFWKILEGAEFLNDKIILPGGKVINGIKKLCEKAEQVIPGISNGLLSLVGEIFPYGSVCQ